MSNNDININVRANYAKEAKRDLDMLAAASRGVGEKTEQAGVKGAASTERATQKLSAMGRVMGSVKTQLLGLAGAWGAFAIAAKVLRAINDKLERTARLLTTIHEKSLSLLEAGQALEMQTGTSGEQRGWTKKALEMQQAGGLKDVSTATQMMISADIAFSESGGIKNPEVMNLLKELAPMMGAAGFSGKEAGKFFSFAGTAGIEATPEAYKEYFAKLLAGQTASTSEDFGAFITGLQTSGTTFLTQGGTLGEAISMYVSALAVSPNEAEAATLFKQALVVSTGANEKLTQAVESTLDVDWSDLNRNQRLQATLQYISSIPESERPQVLKEQGVEGNIAAEVSKFVSPRAVGSAIAARENVGSALPADADAKIDSYINSTLAESRSRQAERELKTFGVSKQLADWQERIKDARTEFELLTVEGKENFFIKDSIEPHAIALRELADDVRSIDEDSLSKDQLSKKEKLLNDIWSTRVYMEAPQTTLFYLEAQADKRGQEYTSRAQDIQQQVGTTVINNNYSNDMIFTPTVGNDRSGPRFSQD